MEYEKDFGKFAVGFGSAKTAGKGDLSNAEETPFSLKNKGDRKAVINTAVKVAAVAGAFWLQHKSKKRKK